MSKSTKIEVYCRWHAEIAAGDRDGANRGIVTPQSIDRLSPPIWHAQLGDWSDNEHVRKVNHVEGRDADVIGGLIAVMGLPWSEFAARIQSAFDAATGSRGFAAALIAIEDECLVAKATAAAASVKIDAISIVRDAELHLVEMAAALEEYRMAASDADKRAAAEWVIERLSGAAAPLLKSVLRTSFEWLVATPNNAQRGRRATALGLALYGPAVFKDSCGRPCTTKEAVYLNQDVTDKTVRDLQRGIPDAACVCIEP